MAGEGQSQQCGEREGEREREIYITVWCVVCGREGLLVLSSQQNVSPPHAAWVYDNGRVRVVFACAIPCPSLLVLFKAIIILSRVLSNPAPATIGASPSPDVIPVRLPGRRKFRWSQIPCALFYTSTPQTGFRFHPRLTFSRQRKIPGAGFLVDTRR